MSVTNLFKVSNFRIQFKDSRQLELMAIGANIPGLTLGEIIINRPVIRDLRNGDQLNFEDLNVTVLLDEKLQGFKEIYNYIILAANPDNANINVVDPIFDSTLFLTTNKNNVQHKITFFNCFFKSISGIDLSSAVPDEEQITFNISLGFSYYRFE